jgi:hypothetical protein
MTSGRAIRVARVAPEEIEVFAMTVELPGGVTDVCMTVVVERGGKLDNGDPDGKGGSTKFGPAWVLEGRRKSEPIALYESQKDALALHAALAGEEGELWQRKQRRLAAIAAAEAAEAAAAQEDAEIQRTARKHAKAVARRDGAGSPRPSGSSERRTASSGRETRRRETSLPA